MDKTFEKKETTLRNVSRFSTVGPSSLCSTQGIDRSLGESRSHPVQKNLRSSSGLLEQIEEKILGQNLRMEKS